MRRAEIRLLEGGKVGDTRVVIEIFEGPKFKIDTIDFVGNAFVDDGVLKTKIESRRGYSRPARRPSVRRRAWRTTSGPLYKYYQDNGYFDVRITAITKPPASNSAMEQIRLHHLRGGCSTRSRRSSLKGTSSSPRPSSAKACQLKPGDPFNEIGPRHRLPGPSATGYWGIGCIDTKIEKDQPVTDEPGFVRVIYRIEEGSPYILGQIIVKGNARTKDKVVRREALMAGLLPGEILDMNRIDTFRRRLGSTGYFSAQPGGPAGAPGGTKGIDIQIINRRSGDKPFGEDVLINPNGVNLTRMQSPEQDPPPAMPPLELPPAMPPLEVPSTPVQVPGTTPPGSAPPATGNPVLEGATPFGAGGQFDPEPNTVPALAAGPPPVDPASRTSRASNPGSPQPGAKEPSPPNNNMNERRPRPSGSCSPGRSYADIVTNVDEAPTGRLMFGFGASSFGGLSGTAILHESNFDIWAIPRSFSELRSGRAFRGAGQELRISLSPGTLMQQYVVSS